MGALTWAKLLSGIVGVIKMLMIPFAIAYGKWQQAREDELRQAANDGELQTEYARIAVKGITDEELDQKLDADGTL